MSALVLAPVLLAAVLVLSAVGKLRDPAAAARAFDELRVPGPLAGAWLRRSLPWAEIALAVALMVVPGPLGVAAGLGALALFGTYTWLVARALRSPADVDCNCFGSLTNGRVTRWTLVRNVSLVGVSLLAVAAAAGGRPPLLRLLTSPDTMAWVLGAAMVGWVVFTILHESPAPAEGTAAPTDRREDGGPEDSGPEDYVRLPIPYAELTDPSGATHQLRRLARERAVLLVWLSLGCGSCQIVLDRLPEWVERLPFVDIRPVFFRSDGVADRLPQLVERHLLDPAGHVQEVFQARGTPMAVVLGADGLLAGGPVLGGDAVVALVDDMIAQLEEAWEDLAEPGATQGPAEVATAAG